MKIPSFVKLPKHKKFTFSPRYYDPIKEEIEMKISHAKSDLKHERLNGSDRSDLIKSRISGSFNRRSTDKKRSFMIQLFITVILVLLTYLLLR